MSLVAQALEQASIATVIIGSAKDIVTHCGAPRFLYTDFPLGNPCGVPYRREMQADIAARALDLLETAEAPGAVVEAPHVWPGGQDWRWRYYHVGPDNADKLREIGEARRREQARDKKSAPE